MALVEPVGKLVFLEGLELGDEGFDWMRLMLPEPDPLDKDEAWNELGLKS